MNQEMYLTIYIIQTIYIIFVLNSLFFNENDGKFL